MFWSLLSLGKKVWISATLTCLSVMMQIRPQPGWYVVHIIPDAFMFLTYLQIQRFGRTGRKREGTIHALLAEGREETNIEKAEAA